MRQVGGRGPPRSMIADGWLTDMPEIDVLAAVKRLSLPPEGMTRDGLLDGFSRQGARQFVELGVRSA